MDEKSLTLLQNREKTAKNDEKDHKSAINTSKTLEM